MQYDWCHYKKRREPKDRHMERRPCGSRLRDCREESTCQGRPMTANGHQELQRGEKRILQREHGLTLDF